MDILTLLVKPASGLCCMDCGYCFYRAAAETRTNCVMTGETAAALIGKIKESGPKALSVVFQGGEPTLAGLDFFKSFVDAVEKSLSIPVFYALQTNGLLVDDDFAAFFRKNCFLVGLSLDGGRETNDRYRRGKNGESVFDRANAAADVLKKRRVDFSVLSVVDDENAKDIEKTYSFFKTRGFDRLQFIPCVDEGRGVSLSPEAYEGFLKKSFDLWYDDLMKGEYVSVRHIDNYIRILAGGPPENCAMRGVCGGYFVVEANGDVYPCDFYCKDEYRIGSVFDEKPFEPGEKLREFVGRSLVIHESCEGCEYHYLCRGGCRRDRTEDLTRNIYCEAYKGFFAHFLERMRAIVQTLPGGGLL